MLTCCCWRASRACNVKGVAGLLSLGSVRALLVVFLSPP